MFVCVKSIQVKPSQAKSSQVRSSQVESNQVKTSQVVGVRFRCTRGEDPKCSLPSSEAVSNKLQPAVARRIFHKYCWSSCSAGPGAFIESVVAMRVDRVALALEEFSV